MRRLFFLITCCLLIVACTTNKTDYPHSIHFLPSDSSLIIQIDNPNTFKSSFNNNEFLSSFEEPLISERIFKIVEKLHPSQQIWISLQATKYTIAFKFSEQIQPKDSTHIFYNAIENQIDSATIQTDQWYYTKKQNHILISTDKNILMNDFKKENPLYSQLNPLIRSINSSKAATHLYIHSKHQNTPFEKLFGDQWKRSFSDWSVMDIQSTSQNNTFSGVSMSTQSNSILNLLSETQPLSNRIPEIVPATSKELNSYTFSNSALLRFTKAVDSLFLADIYEIGFMTTEKGIASGIFSYDIESTFETLETTPEVSIRNQMVYRILNSPLLNASFESFLPEFKPTFCSVIDDFMYFTESIETMEYLITQQQNKSTFIHSNAYLALVPQMTSESSFMVLNTISQNKQLQQVTTDKKFQLLSKQFKLAVFQATPQGNAFLTHIALQKSKGTIDETGVSERFQVKLDNDIATHPQFVLNHRTKSKEIVVQDTENNLYLISSEGKILWKKALDSKIQGKITQVDLYKNGNLQLAFTTEKMFIVIDRNGNIVTPFNKKFEDNLLPLAVFDYDKTLDYRFLLISGKQWIMLDRKGNTVNGFTKKTSDSLLFSPEHFRIGNKDYIAAMESNGTLLLLDRTGNTRIPVKERFPFSDNTIAVYEDTFTFTDQNGTLWHIDQKGGMRKVVKDLKNGHGFTATSKTIVTLSDNLLSIKGRTIEIDFGMYTKPEIYYVNNKIYITFTDTQTQKLYIYDSNSNLLPNFPIFGIGAAVIDLSLIHISEPTRRS